MSRILFSQKRFRSISPALQRAVLQEIYESAHGSTESLSFKLVEDVRDFVLESPTGKRKVFGKKITLENRYGDVIHPKVEAADVSFDTKELEIPGITEWGNYHIDARIKKYRSPTREFFMDMDSVKGQKLFIRSWHSGDRFIPLGMKRNKKLQDFFTDLKISRGLRKTIPLIVDDQDRILAVYNLRISDLVKATQATKRTLLLNFKTSEK